MPSSPLSAPTPPKFTRSTISMNSCAVPGLLVSNHFTTPACSTTNQRRLFAGACNIATGCVKDSEVNRLKEISLLPVGLGHAVQVVFDGRASRPGSGEVGGGVG